ncbi:MAG: 3-hydroxylacyl-ACP dehydratase [Rhodoferax sp.]
MLDAVTAWDGTHIVCCTGSHRALDNPLRAQGRLGAACGVEFAAQAMALHGALLAERETEGGSGAARVGYLASVRSVDLHVQRLDNVAADLTVTADRLLGDASHVLYHFRLEAGTQLLLEGRAAVVLDAAMLRDATGPAQVPGESL